MAIGGNPRPAPVKSSAGSRRRGTDAANPPPPSAAASTTRDGTHVFSRPPIVAHERPEPHGQQDQPQPQPQQHQQQPQHAQRHQHQSQQHLRHQQNRVGKRYRDKLTAGFESLQTALGLDGMDDELDAAAGLGGGGSRGGGGEGARGDGPVMMGSADGAIRRRRRPLNKARIIDLTCERVRELVGEWEVTRAEMEAMRRERALQGW